MPPFYVEVPKSNTRDELMNYARFEFERNRDVTDLVWSLLSPENSWIARRLKLIPKKTQIRYLISVREHLLKGIIFNEQEDFTDA